MNLYNLQSKNIEFQFLFLMVYVGVLAVYLIGISNPHFVYHINLPFLDQPNILSIMLSDILLIVYVTFGRILFIFELNKTFDQHSGNISLLQDYFNTLKLNSEFYLAY